MRQTYFQRIHHGTHKDSVLRSFAKPSVGKFFDNFTRSQLIRVRQAAQGKFRSYVRLIVVYIFGIVEQL